LTSFISTNGQTFIQAGGAIITNIFEMSVGGSQPFKQDPSSPGGGLTKRGPAALILTGGNTYTGPTIIKEGTLTLQFLGSIGSSTEISIAAGAALNLSSNVTYTLSGANTVTASGVAGSPASILGDATPGVTNVDFGSRPVRLNYTPTAFIGDSTAPALSITQGALNLNGPVTVYNDAGTPMGAGTYVIAQQASGTITGAPTLTGVLPGTLGQGLAGGLTASLNISGTDLQLVVAASTINPNPTNITYSVSGSTLNLSWPPDYLGWYLQSNSVALASASDWHTVPNSQTVTNLAITISASKTNVFFRMLKP
jgi:autotransporter-associated beta strand protein